MANLKITQLTGYNTPIATDVMPIVDITNMTTKKISWDNIQSSGSGVPATTPKSIGAIYIDTLNSNAYIAVGVSTSSDWKIISII